MTSNLNVETRANIKFCVNLGHTPTETLRLLEKSNSAKWKAKVSRSGGKHMFVFFADRRGMILQHRVPEGQTVNADYYSKHNHHHNSNRHYDTDGDELSTTLTYQSGYSSEYRPHNLSRLSRHSIKLKSSSSFPNLLSLYQTPIKEESTIEEVSKGKKKNVRKRRERKKNEEFKHDHDDPHERRARQEIRQLRMDAVAREQLDKFDNYVKSMKDKVEKQREERKRYNEVLQERLREQEEAERKKLRLHRGTKHVYVHDRKYLKTLPVSNYCKATRLADELQRKGVLRTRGDVDKFWAGYSNNQRRSTDIFSESESNSVNYPQKWMTTMRPEITITENDEDEETITEALDLHHRQLPPIKTTKKKLQ